jgi:hypothetical protein
VSNESTEQRSLARTVGFQSLTPMRSLESIQFKFGASPIALAFFAAVTVRMSKLPWKKSPADFLRFL